MAPKKGQESPMELCTEVVTLGNHIAVHCLEYLDVAASPPANFNKLAMEFLEDNRVLIAIRAGLRRASVEKVRYAPDITKQLVHQISEANTTFGVLRHTVNRLLDAEKKHGLGKLGRSFRMMFADSDIARLLTALTACRQEFRLNTLVHSWTIQLPEAVSTSDIGYTALAAVLGVSETTSPRPSLPDRSHSDITGVQKVDRDYLKRMDDTQLEGHAAPVSLSTDPAWSDSTVVVTDHFNSPMLKHRSRMSTSDTTTVHTSAPSSPDGGHSNQFSLFPDTFKTTPDTNPRCDSMTLLRRIPRHAEGMTTAASRLALVAAVQKKDHLEAERLLDTAVPPDNGSGFNLLRGAVINRDLDMLRLLLAFGADPNAKDEDNMTPLHAATEINFFAAGSFLVDYGAKTEVCAGPNRETPLAIALTNDSLPFVQFFLKHGADPCGRMENGDTPFVQCMSKAISTEIVTALLVAVKHPNQKNDHGETALYRAIVAGRLDLVNILLAHGADPNLPAPKHMLWPAVHHPPILAALLENGAALARAPGVLELATSMNSLQAVEILLKHNVDVNAKKDGIFTPLCTAIRDDHGDIVDMLLAAGADPNLMASEYPAFKCVTHNRLHFLPRLFAAGADVNHPKGIVETAVVHKNQAALQILLDSGADINARTPKGHTALTTAIRTKQIEMVDFLLSHGADPSVRGEDWPVSMAVDNPTILSKLLANITLVRINQGALEKAVQLDSLESVKLLIAKGVDVEEKNGGVFSPLTTAIRENRKEIFFYLIDEAGADPNAPGEHLPIIKAIRRHREDDLSYIKHLLVHGADVNLMYRGWNAVLQALDNGDMEVLKLLATQGRPDLQVKDDAGRSVLEILDERGMSEEKEILLASRPPPATVDDALDKLRSLVINEMSLEV